MLERYEDASILDLSPPLCNGWDFSKGGGILLHGPKGTGKTHAAVAMWKYFHEAYPMTSFKQQSPYISVARLFAEKRRSMDGRQSEGFQEPDWRNVRFVVFDDWDKCRASEWVLEELFIIIDTLYTRMVPIIITTNLRPPDFARYSGEFIADRLKEMVTPIAMHGESRRGNHGIFVAQDNRAAV